MAQVDQATLPKHMLIDGKLVGAERSYPTIDLELGGYKQSGVGREMGKAGLEEFFEMKTLAIPVPPAAEGATA